jgi:hypothetical protein
MLLKTKASGVQPSRQLRFWVIRRACSGPGQPVAGQKRAHFSLKTKNLFPWRADLLPGSSGENAPGTAVSAWSSYPAELRALDVRGLQPFRAGFHFKGDSCAFF